MLASSTINPAVRGAATGTWLDGLDVRSKMLVSVVAAVATIAMGSLQAQAALFVFSFIYLLSMRKWKIMLFSYAMVLVMMTLSVGCVLALGSVFPSMAKGMNLYNLAIPFLRLLTTLNVILPLAFTSRIQTILHSLQLMRLPFCIYLPAAVIIRFIPTFANDILQVWESLKIRGWKLTPLFCTLHPVTTTRLLFTPLLFRSLKTSDELGIAAELKGLSCVKAKAAGRKEKWGKNEWLLFFATAAVLALAVYLQILFPGKGGVH